MQSFPFDSYVTYDSQGNPTYDRAVSSQPLRTIIRKLFTTGVMPNPSTNFQVNAGTDGMTVLVQPGFAVVDGGLCKEDEVRTLSVTAADAKYDRIDTVVLRWNENVDVRTADLYVLAGTPAETPIRPALQRNDSIYEIGLADVFITHGIATITEDKITNTRYESERCGIVSSVSEWDTTTIYQQIQSDLAGFKSNEQAEFMTWFNKMKDQLTEDAAGKLQTEVDDLTNSVGDVKRQICTNLLNPTAKTQTINGVTFTNNGDGTYTVNGTNKSSSYVSFNLEMMDATPYRAKKLRFFGCPSGGAYGTYQQAMYALKGSSGLNVWSDAGNGYTNVVNDDAEILRPAIYIYPGITVSNLVFKPMITTDLSATYDDFVPYTGDSGRLNEDISDVNRRLTQVQTQIVPTASIESGETASKAYSKGDFLVKNGVLYKVTNAIVKGDALTVGENIDSTTVVGELSKNRVHLSLDAVAVGKDEDGDTIYEKTFKGTTISSGTVVDSNLTISNLKWIRLVGGCINDNDKTMFQLPFDATTSSSRNTFIVYSNSKGLVVDCFRITVKMYHFTIQYVLK